MKRLTLLLAATLLGACSILPQSEPLDIYLLPAAQLPAQSQQVDWALRINSPSSSQLLDGTRIVVLPEPDRVNTYQGVRWSERTPQLLRNRLLDAFQDDGRIQALSNEEQRLQADLELVSDLRSFHSEYRNGIPYALIRLEVNLVDARDQRILASRRFSISQPASDTSVPAVIAAFGQAGDQLSRELVDWTLNQGQRATP
ncbi:ABC-type transport auxiliary lipoprotein family protein [Ectopseudomonas hydrolytica]|uniref:ABC-type transport auxiliary lipoprotein family protein n=1 Tax=Ectopseudomonas hydrolytica TaxID=2493633 RepID=A0ABY5A959_9GAMM|nr:MULTISPECIES: ABC-type transport auxiliary lipoprotein family protein [Pseudomonas]MDH0098058.1 ABC-type transport auxiliary lipoprotein family protein [Pseudomonas sp. GD04158]USR40260.1 ABC-type transport auxiliary lipoprotein family protein [Pseudomonas hydrolytica]